MKKFTRKRETGSGNVTKTIDTHSVCLYVSGISFELVNIPKGYLRYKTIFCHKAALEM